MKKLIISSVLGVALAASTAFGQGYILFGGGSRTVWNDTGTSVASAATTPVTDSGFEASFLWSASSTTSPMGSASVATNNSSAYSSAAAWTAIEGAGASGWTAATTGGAAIVGGPANNLGSFSYNGNVPVSLDGSSAPGQSINLYVIAWETEGGLYTSLASAEAAGAPVGWSSVLTGYVLGSAPPATAPPVTSEAHFGIGPVPEPTTLALAGLGGLSMLFLRRKKA
jgi:hypothetical protein